MHVIGQVLEAVRDALRALAAADGNEQAVDVALEEPRRRVGGVRPGEHDHDRVHVGPCHERLHAVEQHRPPRDPAELLQLGPSHARPAARGDDHHADVAGGRVVGVGRTTLRRVRDLRERHRARRARGRA